MTKIIQFYTKKSSFSSGLTKVGSAWKGTTQKGEPKIEITLNADISELKRGSQFILLEAENGGKPILDSNGKEKTRRNSGDVIVSPHYSVNLRTNEEDEIEKQELVEEKKGKK